MSRIWLINQYALPASGAGGTRHQSLAAEWAASGHETTIWASPHQYATGVTNPSGVVDDGPGLRFHWVPTRTHDGNGLARVLGMLEFSLRVLWRGSRRSNPRPDVVLGSSPNLFAALCAYALARRWRARFILEIRDIWPASVIELMGVKTSHPFIVLLAAIERFLYRRSDHIVGLMDGLDTHVSDVIGPAHPPVAWIPNGVDLALHGGGDKVLRPDGVFVLVYAGAHGVPNSLDTAIDAMAALAGRPIELHLYGNGVLKDTLRHSAAHLPSVVFHDAVPKPEIARVLRQASALVICWKDSPLYAKGVSANKLFDYLASARPIVQSYSGANDIVAASRAGTTVPAEDPTALAKAIAELADLSATELDEMGAHGRTWVEEHRSIRSLAARYLDVLDTAAV